MTLRHRVRGLLAKAKRLHRERAEPDAVAAAVERALDQELARWNRALGVVATLLAGDEAAVAAVFPFAGEQWQKYEVDSWAVWFP
jgi:hypothetical protein